MTVSKRVIGVCIFLVTSAFAVTASAQSQHIQLYEFNVKSGSQSEFTAFVQKVAEAADKTASPLQWLTAQAVTGTSGTNFYIFVGFDNWSERDAWAEAPAMLMEAFGEVEGQKILKMGGESMWGFESTVFDLDEEHSWNMDALGTAGTPAGAAAYYQILLGKVKADKVDDYLSALSSIKQAQEASDSKQPGIRRTASLGDSWTFYGAFPFAKWSDLETANDLWQNVADAVGEANAHQIQRTLRSCYEERTLFVVRAIPELSRSAPASTSN